MPNWLESRASNEDEFVLRRGLIVRSQWSTVCRLCTGLKHIRTYAERGKKEDRELAREKEEAEGEDDRNPEDEGGVSEVVRGAGERAREGETRY